MRFTPGQLVHGVDAKILRHGLRRLQSDWGDGSAVFRPDDLARCMGVTVSEASALLVRLAAEEVVERSGAANESYEPGPGFFRVTAAAINNGVPRAEAEMLLAKVQVKVVEIDGQPDIYWHRVSKLAVFGSYLGDTPVLGDLDIAFEVQQIGDYAHFGYAQKDAYAFHVECVKRMYKTETALRLRRPDKISLHVLAHVEDMGIPYRRLI